MGPFITFTVPPFPVYIASGKGVFHRGERHISRIFTVFDLLYVTKGELWITEDEVPHHVKEENTSSYHRTCPWWTSAMQRRNTL